MSFLQQNWPWLLFAGAMIYMHFFMHRGHGSHRHHTRSADPESGNRPPDGQEPKAAADQHDRHRHGGC